jgi:7-cyano-7-deazaguanine reductase
VESKSLKLYLAGIANTCFDSQSQVKETIRRDLIDIMSPEWFVLDILCSSDLGVNYAFGQCIDDVDIRCSKSTQDPSLLKTHRKETREILYSDLLKTLCPITGQPDWATLVIDYCGAQIDRDALLRYVVSYRNQEGFAEDICNRIFCDILGTCRASRLTTGLYFTRRGGIDISPVRSSHPIEVGNAWTIRTFRQ